VWEQKQDPNIRRTSSQDHHRSTFKTGSGEKDESIRAGVKSIKIWKEKKEELGTHRFETRIQYGGWVQVTSNTCKEEKRRHYENKPNAKRDPTHPTRAKE